MTLSHRQNPTHGSGQGDPLGTEGGSPASASRPACDRTANLIQAAAPPQRPGDPSFTTQSNAPFNEQTDPASTLGASAQTGAQTGFARTISAALGDLIRQEIATAGGLLPFDRFMELALYAPGLGYYAAGAVKFGEAGDFVTAPEISPLFGRCLARQCAEVLDTLGGGDILELGAGTGALAIEILTTLERLGALPERYYILEPSPDLQERQRRRIARDLPRHAERCEWLNGLPTDARGVIIANEVLDAMPVSLFRIGDDGEAEEGFVDEHGGVLREVFAPIRSAGLAAAVADLRDHGLPLHPGYRSEVNLRLAPWMQAMGQALTVGLVLLVDYGLPRHAYYQQDRRTGTLMCHCRHQAHSDPFHDIGLQDITAHVDFSAVADAAVAAGFTLEGFTTQAHFLIGCGIDQCLAEAEDPLALAPGAKQLLLPTAMGERFKVLALGKGLEGTWSGFSVRDMREWLG